MSRIVRSGYGSIHGPLLPVAAPVVPQSASALQPLKTQGVTLRKRKSCPTAQVLSKRLAPQSGTYSAYQDVEGRTEKNGCSHKRGPESPPINAAQRLSPLQQRKLRCSTGPSIYQCCAQFTQPSCQVASTNTPKAMRYQAKGMKS